MSIPWKYHPNETEIYSRGEALQWMTRMGWPIELQEAILVDGNPDVEDVRRMVYQFGPEEARRRILLMLE